MTADVSNEPTIRIVKSGVCPTLSGKSRLTYQVGCRNESECAIRVVSNSAAGFFSNEWLPLPLVEKALRSDEARRGITSALFRPLFRGKSVNTAGFLLAVLRHEGVVARAKEKVRVRASQQRDVGRLRLQQEGRPQRPGGRAQGACP
jgi:hypothetical protein